MKTLALLLVLASGSVRAAELSNLDTVSDSVLALHILDGHGVYPGRGQTVPARLEEDPLNTAALAGLKLKVGSIPVVKIGRKSWGRDYVQVTQPKWGFRYTLEHELFLVLASPMEKGRVYDLDLKTLLGPQAGVKSFVYDPGKIHSLAIHVNEIGYAPSAPKKYAYVSAWLGDLGPMKFEAESAGGFKILDAATGAPAYSGVLRLRKAATEADGGQPNELNHWRTDLWDADFSDFRKPGTYVLSVDRLGASYPFDISDDAYRQPFRTVMHGLYHNRCGTARTQPYTDYVRGLCHHPSLHPVIQSRIRRMDRQCDACSDVEATGEKREQAWGGYHDAGDWDREQGHPEIPLVLAFAYELKPENFKDGELNIPESGNGLPDILDEAIWGMDYYLRIQGPDGGVGYGLFMDSFPQDGEGPDMDTGNWYLYAEDPEASYKVAAAACQVARGLEIAGRKDLAPRYVEAAKKAFDWAGKNLKEGDEDKVKDLRNEAAAGLFRSTGEKAFHDIFVQTCRVPTADTMLWIWGQIDQRFAAWTYALTDRPGQDPALKEKLRQAALFYAKKDYLETSEKRGNRVGYQWWNPLQWGRGSVPDTLACAAAYKLSGDPAFLAVQYFDADSKLGANPMNMVWITGLGEKNPQRIFHPDSWYSSPDGSGRVVPGIVPEGPYRYDGPGNGPGDNGPWSAKYVENSAYPDAKVWPPLELYFEARTCYPMNEFTVIQQAQAAAAYGLLAAPAR